MQKREFRNGTAPWFERYAERMLLKKLGYTSEASQLGSDEVEWFKAVESALGKAQEALRKLKETRRG